MITLCRLLEPKWISKSTHLRRELWRGNVGFSNCVPCVWACIHCIWTGEAEEKGEKKQQDWPVGWSSLVPKRRLWQLWPTLPHGHLWFYGPAFHSRLCWWQASPPSSVCVIWGISGLKVVGVTPFVQGDPGPGFLQESLLGWCFSPSMCTETRVIVMGLQMAIWTSRGEGRRQMKPTQRKAEPRDKTPDPAAPDPQ